MLWIQIALSLLICTLLLMSVYYSIRSRRDQNPAKRGLYAARMNITLGLMLVVIAVTQLFVFNESSLRRIFGTVCVLLGLFNLFAGIRNHGHFDRLLR